MTDLLSTLLGLPDEQRAVVERELVPLARTAALGELAADVAHDVANPLFGAVGLVELLLADAAAGTEQSARLALVAQATSEMKRTLELLLEYARLAADDRESGRLDDATRLAVQLLRHGLGKTLDLEERYPERPVVVPCPPGLLAQAVLQLLIGLREHGSLAVEVTGAAVTVSPAPPDSLLVRLAERIVVDHGGRFERSDGSVSARWSSY